MSLYSVAISLAVGVLLLYSDDAVTQRLAYETSLLYTIQTEQQWYNWIPAGGHYLGAQPLNNMGHLEEILKLDIDSVLVLQEEFERRPGLFNTPVNDTQWTQNGIKVRWIQARDFKALQIDEFIEAVDFLLNESAQYRHVYVHCKAGHGRSASVMIAFVMRYYNWSYTSAYHYIYNLRPSININPHQRDAIMEYSEIASIRHVKEG